MTGAATALGDAAAEPAVLPPAELAALVAARLCHDLVSPLGAIGNGVELLQMAPPGPAAGTAELALVAESVAAARARIASFRIAFGPAGDARMSRADLATALGELTATGRLKAELSSDGDATRAEVKLILLALMCLETALPWGGRVLICRTDTGWRVVGEAQRTRPDLALWCWLGGDRGPRLPTPAEVQFPLLGAEARAQCRRIEWEVDASGADIAF